MVKKRFLLLIIAFLMSAPCNGMQMAAQQAGHSAQTLDETAAKELIEKLLGKTYDDMVNEICKLSDEHKEFVRKALHKNHPFFTSQVRLQQVLSGHTQEVTSVAFSPNGRFALTGAWDNSARLWDLTKSPSISQKLVGHSERVTSIALSHDGCFALTGSDDNTARLWDLTKFPFTNQILTGHTDYVRSVALSPNGNFALTGSWDGTARLWDLTKSPITSHELRGHSNWIPSVSFSPDSRFALTGSADKTARLWDITKTPVTSQELSSHGLFITSTAFSSDSRLFLTGSLDKTAHLWDLTKSPISSKQLKGHSGYVSCVAFSPNGRFALTGACDNTARLWDLSKDPITSQSLRGHTKNLISAVAFSPDSRFALTASEDNTARLWDLSKDPIISKEIKGHTNRVRAVVFSPDGQFALTGSDDHTARLWKIELIDGALTLEDLLLIVKIIEKEDSLKDDSHAVERLQSLAKTEQPLRDTGKLIADYHYRVKLPEKECWICSEKYNLESRICMHLSCCRKIMCKVCLDKLGSMSYSTEFAGYQFQHTVKAKCPFCNKPADQMGTIKKFKIDDPHNHHCSSCDKEKCTLKCGACKTEYYCSKECQAKDWPNHKNSCKKK